MEEIASRNGFLKILLLLTAVSIKHVQCDMDQYERTLVVQLKLQSFRVLTLPGNSRIQPRDYLRYTLYFSGSQRGDLGIVASPHSRTYDKGEVHYFGPNTKPKSVHYHEFRIQSNWTGFTIELDVQDKSIEGRLVSYDNFKLVLQEPSRGFDVDLTSESQYRSYPSWLRLDYNVETRCDRSVFYGKLCQVYCKAEDSDNGHYTCSQEGTKACLPGWLDPDDDCKRPDKCYRGHCQNNGNCSALQSKKYRCTCSMQYTGEQCETSAVDCSEDDKRMTNCINGGMCVIDKGNRKCNCPMGYYGSRCDELYDWCKQYEPCKNGGSCESQVGSYICLCPIGVAGKDCEKVCGRDVKCRDRTKLPGRDKLESSLHQWQRPSSSGIQLLPGTAAVFLGVAAVAMASCLGL